MSEKAKQAAALAALELVEDGMTIGLGTGSTTAYFIEALGRRVKEGLRIKGVPTSYQAYLKAIESGIPLTTLEEAVELDLAVDGADEVDENLNLIKGMGAALAREKVVDSAAKRLIIVVDESKVVKRLGETKPVPVEVLPFAQRYVSRKLKELGGEPKLRLAGEVKDGPVVTDNGNFIIDARFPPIEKPTELEQSIKRLPGVVEVGIFVNMVDVVYVGSTSGVVKKLVKGKSLES